MIKHTISGLMELGLTEKEARLYHAALKMGPATAQQLSLESGVKRATAYACIEVLIEKGLFHIEITGVRKLFIPESPHKLMALVEQKKQRLNAILPQLMQSYMNTSPSTNAIKMYQGLSGVKLVYENILDGLKPGDEYLVLSDHEKWNAMDPTYFEAFMQKRAQVGLDLKVILQHTSKASRHKKNQHLYARQIKILPKSFILNISMVVLPTKVVMTQMVDPLLVILIENKNVAEMNKIMFYTLWELIGD